MACDPDKGHVAPCQMSKSMTDSGNSAIHKITSFIVGGFLKKGSRKKKRYRNSNGTKTTFYRKYHKTNRNKSNVSRLLRTYKRIKEKCNIR